MEFILKNILTVLILLTTFNVWAYTKQKSIGFMVGNPTGLNGKYWLSNDRAVDAAFGVSLGKHTEVSMHSDYLFHKKSAFYFKDEYPLDFYYGLGGRMEFADSIELGARVPAGLSHYIHDETADIFAEVAPILDLVGKFGLELHLAVGGRYYF
jgi:hypothetical protein